MTAPGRDLRLMQHQAAELDARLSAARHTARSADQLVTAVVTGQGTLLDLRIEDRALAGAHAQKLGLAIVEAVRAARTAANAAASPQLNALFGKHLRPRRRALPHQRPGPPRCRGQLRCRGRLRHRNRSAIGPLPRTTRTSRNSTS